MLNKRHFFTFATVGLLLGIIWWLASSVWFVWFALPAGQMRVAFVPHPLVEEVAPNVVPVPLAQVRAAGVSYSATETTVVLLPRLTAQQPVARALHQAGWRVERVGLALRATTVPPEKSGAPLTHQASSTVAALRQAGRAVLTTQLPVQPVLIGEAEVGTLATLDQPVAFIARRRGAGFELELAATLSELGQAPGVQPNQALSDDYVVSLNVPGASLRHVPQALQQQWDRLLGERLQLHHTQPAILRYLAQFSRVSLALAPHELSLRVSGAPEAFTTTLEAWLADDARYTNLEPRWFRLPDGTLGQELAPGARPAVFGDEVAGCRETLTESNQLRLCALPAGASIATAGAVLPELLGTDTWHVSVMLNSPDQRALIGCAEALDPVTKLLCSFDRLQVQQTSAGALLLAQ